MKDEIRANINDARQLEKMYRTNKVHFKQAFETLYLELRGNAVADVWNERLNYGSEEINWGTHRELSFVIIASLVAGLVAKLPYFSSIKEAFFYPRNIGFIVFPPLVAYFAWKNKLAPTKIAFIFGISLASLIFINALPDVAKSDTLILSCTHLLLFQWFILAFAFVGEMQNNPEKQLSYLKYNGELIVMTTLLLIGAAIMTGVTIGLFRLIGFNIEKFYFQNVVVFSLPAAPILGTYLTSSNPGLVGKVSPVIAKIFSPLVLVMLVIYLVFVAYSGKNPYNDREFLVIFNALLIGVMAIIFFSVAEAANTVKNQAEIWLLFLLSVVTIVVNCIALSAIIFRILQYGNTPNRAAVIGSNVLILINVLLIATQLFKVLTKKTSSTTVGKIISRYLPIYLVWIIVVTFLFPFLFHFK